MVIRHDVNPEKYLVCEADYPAVFQLKPASGVATLISDTWAITAAHCLYLLFSNNYEEEPFRVQIAGRENTVVDAVYPPECGAVDEVKRLFCEARGEGKEIAGAFTERVLAALEPSAGPHDIALLKLEQPVSHVAPIALYSGSDEVAQEVSMLGWGAFSTGDRGIFQGDELYDGVFRRARNVVSRIENDMLAFNFDAPAAADVLPLEGINGPGDSGGPALVTTKEGDKLIGISSYSSFPTEEMNKLARQNKIPIQAYGTLEHYTRISQHIGWIKHFTQDER